MAYHLAHHRPSNIVSILAAAALEGWTAVVGACRAMIEQRQYHPELHYMRGPGPRWREKHLQVRDTAL